MGFTGVDDLVSEVTAGKTFKAPFQKATVNSGAGAAGRYYDLFTANGMPAAGAYTGTAGSWNPLTSSSPGALALGTSTVSPDTRHLLSMGAVTTASTGIGGLWLMDYLGYHPACAVTGSPTAISAPTLPRYATGDGVQVMMVAQTAHSATIANVTVNYTDQDGNASTALAHTSIANSAPTTQLWGTTGPFLPLQGGDRGVRAVTSYTITTTNTGTVAFVYVKPLAFIPIPVVNTYTERDFLFQMSNLPQVQDDACLGFVLQANGALAASSAFQGYVDFVWG